MRQVGAGVVHYGAFAQAAGIRGRGEILFKGRDLLKLSSNDLRLLRGNQIGMIFQEPMTALNPVFTIGNQLMEVFRVHGDLSRSAALARAIDMLAKVGVPAPERRVREYPYQLSGGMRQRVMIAMALAFRPALLLADEPTTALDVSIQAQILELMAALKEELGTAVLLITHDLGVVAEVTRRVAVMYTGRIMEEASTMDLFDRPLHPYTQGLMASIPRADASFETESLNEIIGVVPSLIGPSGGMPLCAPVSGGDRYLPDQGPGPGDRGSGSPGGLLAAGGPCLIC